jgi:hypothetical protein
MRALSWGGLLAVAAAQACTLDLVEPRISCGDGFTDQRAGEECDPDDPPSFENACAQTELRWGKADCDAETCKLKVEPEQCCECNDGAITPACGEECEPSLPVPGCPGGWPGMRCNADCTLDVGACPQCECTPGAMVDDLADGPLACGEIDPFVIGRPYTDGSVGWCGADCYYDRSGCSYCGDTRLDLTPQPLWYDIATSPEWCDGDRIDETKLVAAGLTQLVEQCEMLPNARPNVSCNERCDGFVIDPSEPPCCVREYAACPAAEDPVRCCFELAHDGATPCMSQGTLDGGFQEVCKPPVTR